MTRWQRLGSMAKHVALALLGLGVLILPYVLGH